MRNLVNGKEWGETSGNSFPSSKDDSNKVLIVVNDNLKIQDILPGLFNSQQSFALVQHNRITDNFKKLASEQGFHIVHTRPELESYKNPGSKRNIFVLTSGTTGLPKFVKHDDNSLNTFVKLQNTEPLTWFVPAPLGTYAWFQMVYLSLSIPGQDLLIPEPEEVGMEFQRLMSKTIVTAISCTPTFLKYMVLSFGLESCRNLGIKIVTLGGEISTELDLNLARELFPNARITQVYALSEVGPVFTSNDGREGFPLTRYLRGRDFELDNDELIVPQSRSGDMKTWYRTGDLAKLSENRIVIEGRIDKDFVNVGGNRVSLKKIEQITEGHDSIVWAKARPSPSKLMGNLIVVEAVIRAQTDSNLVEEELNRLYLRELAEFEIPSKIEFFKSVPMNRNLKK